DWSDRRAGNRNRDRRQLEDRDFFWRVGKPLEKLVRRKGERARERDLLLFINPDPGAGDKSGPDFVADVPFARESPRLVQVHLGLAGGLSLLDFERAVAPDAGFVFAGSARIEDIDIAVQALEYESRMTSAGQFFAVVSHRDDDGLEARNVEFTRAGKE